MFAREAQRARWVRPVSFLSRLFHNTVLHNRNENYISLLSLEYSDEDLYLTAVCMNILCTVQ
jgi:hypothetical protein